MATQSISSVFADRARKAPEETLVVGPDGSATAGEIDVRANRVAHLLAAGGVRRNDLVAVSLPNGVGFVVACVAIWRVGATPMPIDPQLAMAERAALEDIARPRAAFGTPPTRADITLVDEADAQGESAVPLADSWARSWKAPTSSGSTGRPKIVASTAPALIDPEAAVAPFVPPHAVQLVSSPMWHSTAFTYSFRGLTAGHRLVIEPAFDETRFLAAVQQHQVSWAVLAPPSIRRLLRLPEPVRASYDLSSLSSILHIGGRCPVPDKRALIDWLGPQRVYEVYAGSESNGLTMVRGDDWCARPGTVGTPVGGTEIAIRRADGTHARTGEVGTVWMRRGDDPAYTYLGAPSRRTADGWDTLGDLGHLDADGYLYITEREADVIRRSDCVIYPADVEQVVEELPAVRGAVAFAAECDGHTELAVLLDTAGVSHGAGFGADTVAEHIVTRLGPGHRPDRIIFTDNPIRNDAGKIRRRALHGCDA